MATMLTIKGSDIGRTVDIEGLARELNDHPNGGFVFISKYENKDGAVTDQWLRLCPTSEQGGNGYAKAKAEDLRKVEQAIDDILLGLTPVFGSTLRIQRSAKVATAGHKTAKVGEEVSANTKNFCQVLRMDYPIQSGDIRVMEALRDIQRSIVAPSEAGRADYQAEGDKGLYTLEGDGQVRFYLREVYSHFSKLSVDEQGNIIAGYPEKMTGEAVAIKNAIGKALKLRRDKYRTFCLAGDRFDSIHIAKKVITMDGGAFSVINPETAREWLGVSVDEAEAEELLADIRALEQEAVPV